MGLLGNDLLAHKLCKLASKRYKVALLICVVALMFRLLHDHLRPGEAHTKNGVMGAFRDERSEAQYYIYSKSHTATAVSYHDDATQRHKTAPVTTLYMQGTS